MTHENNFPEHGVLVPSQDPKTSKAFRGLVFPNRRDGNLIQVRIVTQNSSTSYPQELPPTPVVIDSLDAPSGLPFAIKSAVATRIYFIVKSDLEMLLLSRYAYRKFNIVGLGEPGIKPDLELHRKLRNSDLILVCLDNESDGVSDDSKWWLDIYPQARWYPYPVGENLNDAYMQGVDIESYAKNALKAILTESPTHLWLPRSVKSCEKAN